MHFQDNESDARKRAFTKTELHAFFEHCDNEVAHATQPADAASSKVRPLARYSVRLSSSSGGIAAVGWGLEKAR